VGAEFDGCIKRLAASWLAARERRTSISWCSSDRPPWSPGHRLTSMTTLWVTMRATWIGSGLDKVGTTGEPVWHCYHPPRNKTSGVVYVGRCYHVSPPGLFIRRDAFHVTSKPCRVRITFVYGDRYVSRHTVMLSKPIYFHVATEFYVCTSNGRNTVVLMRFC